MNVCYLCSYTGQECGSILVLTWISREVADSCQPGLPSSVGLTVVTSKMTTHMANKLGLVFGGRPQFLPNGGLSTGCLSVLTTRQLAFLTVSDSRERETQDEAICFTI